MNQAIQFPTTINPATPAQRGWTLKKLSQKHKTIVALHLQSMKREDIGKLAQCTPEYVSMLLQQPLVQEYLVDLERYMDTRLRSLYGKSVDAIERGLGSGDDEVALKAARLQMESTGKMKGQEVEKKSAEDVVAAILAHVNLTVNVNTGVSNDASCRTTFEPDAEARNTMEE